MYRNPSGNVENYHELLEQKILDLYQDGPCDILAMGDTNIDYLKKVRW